MIARVLTVKSITDWKVRIGGRLVQPVVAGEAA